MLVVSSTPHILCHRFLAVKSCRFCLTLHGASPKWELPLEVTNTMLRDMDVHLELFLFTLENCRLREAFLTAVLHEPEGRAKTLACNPCS